MSTGFLDPAAPRPRVIPRNWPDWQSLDAVLLDMDGTLLDLRFDNFFWLELVPRRFAELHNMTLDAAQRALAPRFEAKRGTLDWYCTDFWTRELSLDICGLKREVRAAVQFLPGAEAFLVELQRRGLAAMLVTNAHFDTLAVKTAQTGIARYFSRIVSSHSFGAPKEDSRFWERFQGEVGFDPTRVLFIDDTLAVLRAAQRHGVSQLFAISRPDSTLPLRTIEEFPSIESVGELLRQ
jgi:5'-nucleotidase